jgi:hypothetical protein
MFAEIVIENNNINTGDNGQNPIPITQVEKLVNKQVIFYDVDLLDYNSLSKVFDKVSTLFIIYTY